LSTSSVAWVQPAPFRALLGHLEASTGLEPAVLAVLAGVPTGLVLSLLHGHGGRPLRRMHRECAERLLKLTPEKVQRAVATHCDGAVTTRRLRRLIELGLRLDDIATHVQVSSAEVRSLASGRAFVSRLVMARVAVLLESVERPLASRAA